MKRFNCYHFRLALVIILSCLCTSINAQIKYTSEGRLLIGDVQPQGHYHTLYGNIYMKEHYGNFFQIDVTPGAPRLAGHGDQVVFYNTQTSTFNSIQMVYLQPIITQYFIDNKSEIWLLFLIAHSKR